MSWQGNGSGGSIYQCEEGEVGACLSGVCVCARVCARTHDGNIRLASVGDSTM